MVYFLFGLFAFLGVLFGWIAFFRLSGITREIESLKREIRLLSADGNSSSDIPDAKPVNKYRSPESTTTPQEQAAHKKPGEGDTATSTSDWIEQTARPIPESVAGYAKKSAGNQITPDWIENFKNNWMIWLGGACIGLAGIFLAKYSIDQGYLGPGARVTGGILLGLALHSAAEYLRRTREGHKALAALAAGGSITLFAALLASLHLYQLMNVWLVFAGLSIVALFTMALALLHGPILAILGILAAYLVPVLIGGQAGNALSASVYALIISASALFLIRYVYRPWLWLGLLAGGFFWWFKTLGAPGMELMSSFYLAIFAYQMISIPTGDFLLLQERKASESLSGLERFYTPRMEGEKLLPVSLLLVVLSQLILIVDNGFDTYALLKYTPLCLLFLQVGSNRVYASAFPWVLLLSLLAGWILSQLDGGSIRPLAPVLVNDFYWYSLFTAAIFSVIPVFIFRFLSPGAIWISIAAVAPVLFLALTFILTTDAERSLQWGLLASVLAGFYLVLTRISGLKWGGATTLVWLFIASHLAYSLAVAMFLRQASMTLALAVQIISLAWIIKRYELKEIGWVLKGVTALVVLRLTLNPWLQQYPTDIHWSLWTYGGATLCSLAGAILLKGRKELQQWVWVAVLHLFALTLWAETRYWLYDGNVYSREYTFTEAVLNMGIFGMLGLVYFYRVKTSILLAPIYKYYSALLICFSLINYIIIMLATLFSFSWAWSEIGPQPLLNFMLFAYGFPVVLGYLFYLFYSPVFKAHAALFTAANIFIFISLEVRHLWQRTVSLAPDPLDGELYTYSAIWLIVAVACILGGVWRYGKMFYKGGMLLLVVVIAKLFLIDMSDLEGLLRVASFLGMGLGLLGIAYLHQRLSRENVSSTGEQ